MKNTPEKTLANEHGLSVFNMMQEALQLVKEVLVHQRFHGTKVMIAFNYHFTERFTRNDAQILLTELEMQNQIGDVYTDQIVENLFDEIVDRRLTFFESHIQKILDSKDKYDTLIDKCKRGWPNFRAVEHGLQLKLDNSNNLSEALAAIDESFSDALNKYDTYQFINTDDIFQFGQKNEWVAISEASKFKGYLAILLRRLAEVFIQEDGNLYVRGDHKSLEIIKMTNGKKPTIETLTEIIKHCKSMLLLISDADKMVKSMNRDYFLEHLKADIVETFNNTKIEVTAVEVKAWQSGNYILKTNSLGYSYLRIKYPFIETSQNYKIVTEDFLWLYQELCESRYNGKEIAKKRIELNLEDGAWKLEVSLDEKGTIKIGCHTFSWTHVEQFVSEYLGIWE